MLDNTDRRILSLLQEDASTPIAEIAASVGISTSPCWRRIQRLKRDGIIDRPTYRIAPDRVNLGLLVFVAVRIDSHTEDWRLGFETATSRIPEIIELHRLAGQIDYLMKVRVPDIEHLDMVYKRLTREVAFADISSMISMETLKEDGLLPLVHG